MATLSQAIPAMPVRDAAFSSAFYRDKLGFQVLHEEDGFAVLGRDDARVHLWQAGDETWRDRDSIEQPVRSGAESFIAGTASCRIAVQGVEELYDELKPREVLHKVSRDGLSDTDFGTREFATVDRDNNLITFFQWVAQ